MPTLDIFKDDAFGLVSLTKAINEQPHVPGRIGELGLFSEEGVPTVTVAVEKLGETLALVAAGERGKPAENVKRDGRNLVDFRCIHLPQRASILADEILGVRAFGSETELQTIQGVVNKRLAKMKTQIEATIEYQRIGAIMGQILDADGSTVLVDIFDRFGLTQQSHVLALSTDSTKVRVKINEAKRKMESALGNAVYRSARVLCSASFFDAFVSHPNVEKFYLNWQAAADLRGDVRTGFLFGDVFWEEYRGKVGSTSFIADGDAYMVPEGVPDMFVTHYGPADYVETVNTIGLPHYAKQELMDMGKGVTLECQSNPISLNTRPRASIKLSIA